MYATDLLRKQTLGNQNKQLHPFVAHQKRQPENVMHLCEKRYKEENTTNSFNTLWSP